MHWTSVEDALPENDDMVLLAVLDGFRPQERRHWIAGCYVAGRWRDEYGQVLEDDWHVVTHWATEPPPPDGLHWGNQ